MVKTRKTAVVIISPYDGGETIPPSDHWLYNERNKAIKEVEGLMNWEWDLVDIKTFAQDFYYGGDDPTKDNIMTYLTNLGKDKSGFSDFAIFIHDHQQMIKTLTGDISGQELHDKVQNIPAYRKQIICNGGGSGLLARDAHDPRWNTMASHPGDLVLGDHPQWDYFDLGRQMLNLEYQDFELAFNLEVIRLQDLDPPQTPVIWPKQ